MTAEPKAPRYYYYAAGERVPLELEPDKVAVDLGSVASAALERAARPQLAKVRKAGRATPLGRGVHLLERGDLTKTLCTRLEKAGALRPVFRHGKTLLVALPEVRIEVEGRKQGSSIARMFGKKGPDVEIVSDRGTQLTLRPVSGSGLDALHLANEVEETAHPLLAQVRFLRVVPKR